MHLAKAVPAPAGADEHPWPEGSAVEAAAGRGVDGAGGASTIRQGLSARVVDELVLDIAPVLLGLGERLFDGVSDLALTPVEAMHSPLATHIRYRLSPPADDR